MDKGWLVQISSLWDNWETDRFSVVRSSCAKRVFEAHDVERQLDGDDETEYGRE